MSTTDFSISVALTPEREHVQHPVSYISKVLHDVKLNMVYFAGKDDAAFGYYFLSAQVLLPSTPSGSTYCSMKAAFGLRDHSGRVMKWAAILAKYDIDYKPQMAVKWQVLAGLPTDLPAIAPSFDCISQN